MTEGLRLTVVVYALGVAAWFAGLALTNRRATPALTATLGVLEIGLVLQAAFDVGHLVSGRRSPEPGTHLAYVAVSLVIVPLSLGGMQLRDRRMSGAAMAMCCAVVAVVSLRLDQTLGAR